MTKNTSLSLSLYAATKFSACSKEEEMLLLVTTVMNWNMDSEITPPVLMFYTPDHCKQSEIRSRHDSQHWDKEPNIEYRCFIKSLSKSYYLAITNAQIMFRCF